MLEMNPRATPICHLARDGGNGLAAVMLGAMTGHAPAVRLPVPGDTIALFPNEWSRDPTSSHLRDWHDAPWDDPPLLRAALAELAASERLERLRGTLRRLRSR